MKIEQLVKKDLVNNIKDLESIIRSTTKNIIIFVDVSVIEFTLYNILEESLLASGKRLSAAQNLDLKNLDNKKIQIKYFTNDINKIELNIYKDEESKFFNNTILLKIYPDYFMEYKKNEYIKFQLRVSELKYVGDKIIEFNRFEQAPLMSLNAMASDSALNSNRNLIIINTKNIFMNFVQEIERSFGTESTIIKSIEDIENNNNEDLFILYSKKVDEIKLYYEFYNNINLYFIDILTDKNKELYTVLLSKLHLDKNEVEK